jgi:predicted RNase H-like nuclease (RuvC/YqgF family)
MSRARMTIERLQARNLELEEELAAAKAEIERLLAQLNS